MYASNSVQFIGIALDDVPKVRDYAEEMRIDYALLIGGMEALAVSRDLGNRGGVLPFTVVLDRAGKVAFVHAGALTETLLGQVLTSLL
jgi:peroxiredoxin